MLERFERGCKGALKKFSHPKNIDEGAKNVVEDEMKTNEYGQSLTSINRGFGGVSIAHFYPLGLLMRPN